MFCDEEFWATFPNAIWRMELGKVNVLSSILNEFGTRRNVCLCSLPNFYTHAISRNDRSVDCLTIVWRMIQHAFRAPFTWMKCVANNTYSIEAKNVFATPVLDSFSFAFVSRRLPYQWMNKQCKRQSNIIIIEIRVTFIQISPQFRSIRLAFLRCTPDNAEVCKCCIESSIANEIEFSISFLFDFDFWLNQTEQHMHFSISALTHKHTP